MLNYFFALCLIISVGFVPSSLYGMEEQKNEKKRSFSKLKDDTKASLEDAAASSVIGMSFNTGETPVPKKKKIVLDKGFEDEDLQSFCQTKHLKNVTELDLWSNNMTNKALQIIENSVLKLKKINLSTNNLKGDVLGDILKMNNEPIAKLFFRVGSKIRLSSTIPIF